MAGVLLSVPSGRPESRAEGPGFRVAVPALLRTRGHREGLCRPALRSQGLVCFP